MTPRIACTPYAGDLRGFEEIVAAAADAGVTHVFISALEGRTDFGGAEKGNPWVEWSVRTPAFFKFVLPPGLEGAYPAEFVSRQMDALKRRHEIVARHGLRAAFFANEPHWLSEDIYARHPEWRGPRCDNSLRTVDLFFAPCLDHPEVLDLYRNALAELLAAAPLLDTFVLQTNDSGSGLCWSGHLYVNANGPSLCQGRPMGERVVGFLRVIRDAVVQAGSEPAIALDTRFPAAERDGIAMRMEPGMLWRPRQFGWGSSVLVNRCPSPPAAITGSHKALMSPLSSFGMGAGDPILEVIKVLRERPAATLHARQAVDLQHELACRLFAGDVADEVVDAWQQIARAEVQQDVIQASRLLKGGLIMRRWLVRPLVAHQELLSEEEKAYWLPNVYQSAESQPESYLDYLNGTGLRRPAHWSEARVLSAALEDAADSLRGAARTLQAAAAKTSRPEAREALLLDARRLHAQVCLLMTARNTIHVALLSIERDACPRTVSVDPETPASPKGSQGLEFMHRALRWELDNVGELIRLLEESPVPLLNEARDTADEGPLQYGPGILASLRRKREIMLRHWRDAEIGYYRPTLGG